MGNQMKLQGIHAVVLESSPYDKQNQSYSRLNLKIICLDIKTTSV